MFDILMQIGNPILEAFWLIRKAIYNNFRLLMLNVRIEVFDQMKLLQSTCI